jgi:hypothetical protein
MPKPKYVREIPLNADWIKETKKYANPSAWMYVLVHVITTAVFGLMLVSASFCMSLFVQWNMETILLSLVVSTIIIVIISPLTGLYLSQKERRRRSAMIASQDERIPKLLQAIERAEEYNRLADRTNALIDREEISEESVETVEEARKRAEAMLKAGERLYSSRPFEPLSPSQGTPHFLEKEAETLTEKIRANEQELLDATFQTKADAEVDRLPR